EAFDMFESMLARLRESVTRVMAHVEVRPAAHLQAMAPAAPQPARVVESRVDPAGAPLPAGEGAPMGDGGGDVGVATRTRPAASPAASAEVPGNVACPCGSGKKYKRCHGAAA